MLPLNMHAPWVAVLSAGGLLILCVSAILGLGAWFTRHDRVEAVGIGLALQGFLFGGLGLFGLPLASLTIAILICGLFGFTRFYRLPWNADVAPDKTPVPLWARITHLLIVIFIGSRFLFALYPQLQADPLSYHVASAKVWAETNTLEFIPWLPWALQGGSFEYFYTFVATIIREPVTLLLACQVAHVFFGSLIVAVTLYSIALQIGLPRNTALLVVLASSLCPIDSLMMIRAKNDGVTLLFSLLALRSVLKNRPLHGGIFAGAAVAAKWSGLFFVLPFVAMTVVFKFKESSTKSAATIASKLCLGIALMVLPIALRNWLWTHDPMFPAMGRLFPSPELTPLLLDEVAKFTYAGDLLAGLRQKASWYLWSVPAVCVALAFPWIKPPRPTVFVYSVALATLVFFALMTGTAAYPRFALVTIALLSVCAGFVWWKMEAHHPAIPWFILAAILIGTGFDVPTSNVVRKSIPFWFYSGSTKDFLREESPLIRFQIAINQLHLSPEPIILACYENETLFLDGGETIPFNHAGGSRVLFAENPQRLAETLKKEQFTHLLLKQDALIPCWDHFFRHADFQARFQLILKDTAYALYAPR